MMRKESAPHVSDTILHLAKNIVYLEPGHSISRTHRNQPPFWGDCSGNMNCESTKYFRIHLGNIYCESNSPPAVYLDFFSIVSYTASNIGI